MPTMYTVNPDWTITQTDTTIINPQVLTNNIAARNSQIADLTSQNASDQAILDAVNAGLNTKPAPPITVSPSQSSQLSS